jgi:hypothetical protein
MAIIKKNIYKNVPRKVNSSIFTFLCTLLKRFCLKMAIMAETYSIITYKLDVFTINQLFEL